MNERLDAVALASLSPRRRDLLEGLGLQVTVIRSAFDEKAATWDGDPPELAAEFACRKAAAAENAGPSLVIAADTIVVIDGQLLGKPADPNQAARMLRTLSGREHTVYTGFCVVDRAKQQQRNGVESTSVRFLPLTDAQIASYVARGDPMDKAGAYGIQGRGGLMVSAITGDFFTVMGLPLARLGQALVQLGYDLLAQ
ncbi:MAG TPA: Maf family protein [Candidatus Eremiobacteraceae bacterium]|nr:Maf family protein [Candidatus Eremiobacteraceae bacterium]